MNRKDWREGPLAWLALLAAAFIVFVPKPGMNPWFIVGFDAIGIAVWAWVSWHAIHRFFTKAITVLILVGMATRLLPTVTAFAADHPADGCVTLEILRDSLVAASTRALELPRDEWAFIYATERTEERSRCDYPDLDHLDSREAGG